MIDPQLNAFQEWKEKPVKLRDEPMNGSPVSSGKYRMRATSQMCSGEAATKGQAPARPTLKTELKSLRVTQRRAHHYSIATLLHRA